jgi:hypothetical protein
MLFYGCKKNDLPTTRVSLQIVNPVTGEPVFFETITGNWDYLSRQLNMDAYGYHFEVFKMNVANVKDTGMLRNLPGNEIIYSNGLEFYSAAVQSDNIHISKDTRDQITGEFKTVLLSGTNEFYSIGGSFEIDNLN